MPAVALCAAVLLLRCARDYNPFAHAQNAIVFVNHATFADSAAIPIFQTHELVLGVVLTQHIDSIRIASSANRFWPHTDSVLDPDSPLFRDSIVVPVSLYDTGWQSISITTYRIDFTTQLLTFHLHAVSPLAQKPLDGFYGDSIALSTPPVTDPDIFYLWDFQLSRVRSSFHAVTVPTPASAGATGQLYVVDRAGAWYSPAVLFSFAFKDTAAPVISADDAGTGDTILTADTTYIFSAHISDHGFPHVHRATVNGVPFDIVEEPHYIKVVGRTDTARGVQPLTVRATDNVQFGNRSERTFYLIFDPGAHSSTGPHLAIRYPSRDSSVSARPLRTLFGSVVDFTRDTVTANVEVVVGETGYPTAGPVSGHYRADWYRSVQLARGANRVTVTATSPEGAALAETTFTIFFDPLMADTSRPHILDIRADGRSAGYFFTDRESVTVQVIAADEGSGVARVALDAAPYAMTLQAGTFRWSAVLALLHKKSGTRITMTAIDSAGYSRDTSIALFRNRLPRIVRPPAFPLPWPVGTAWHDTLGTMDPDGDEVSVTMVRGPALMAVGGDGPLSWTPAPHDTGYTEISLRLFDGYQDTFWVGGVYVADSSSIPPAVRIATPLDSFPDMISAGGFPLVERLHAAEGTGARPLTWRATDLHSGRELPVSDSVLSWIPSSADTGMRQLAVTATDRYGTADTIYPQVLVLPANRSFALRCSATVALDGANVLDLSDSTAAETLWVIVEDGDAWPWEEHRFDLRRSGFSMNGVFDSTGRIALVCNPALATVNTDTVRVSVTDRAGHRDSIACAVVYTRVRDYRLRITLNTTALNGGAGIDNAVTGFPLLVRLADSTFDFSQTDSSGSTVRFRKADGTPLPFEIEQWDSAARTAAVWVLMDTVYGASASQSIVLTVDGSGSGQNSAAVFDTSNGFRAVWHLGESASGTGTDGVYREATVNGFHGMDSVSASGKEGVAGSGQEFDGNDDNIIAGYDIQVLSGVSTAAASFWVKMRSMGRYELLGISINNQSDPVSRVSLAMYESGEHDVRARTRDNGGMKVLRSEMATTAGVWHHLGYTIDFGAGIMRLYLNGTPNGSLNVSFSHSTTDPAPSTKVAIGSDDGTNQFFIDGWMDEVRISSVVRSAAWIKLSYENQRPGSGVVSIERITQ